MKYLVNADLEAKINREINESFTFDLALYGEIVGNVNLKTYAQLWFHVKSTALSKINEFKSSN